MEELTPGKKLILELLAKSVAKFQLDETGRRIKIKQVLMKERYLKIKFMQKGKNMNRY